MGTDSSSTQGDVALLDADRFQDDEALWAARGLTLMSAADTGRMLVERALQADPCPVLGAALTAVDPADLDGDSRVDLIRVWQRLAAWVEAQQQAALASIVAATEDCGLEGDLARHEIGAALRLSPPSAYDRVRRARALTGRFTETLAALQRAEISGLQAAAIVDSVERLDPEVAAVVEQKVLARAAEQTLAETKRSLRRAVLAADPDGAADRAEQARAERTVTRNPLDDGMAELRAVLTATDAELVWAELTARASAEQQRLADAGIFDRGIDALRVDALVAAVLRPGTGSDGQVAPRQARVQLQVTIDLPTLLGLAQNPAELRGYGPLAPDVAREMAADAEWVRWTTDPQTGELLDLGRRRYRPSSRLAAFIRARDPRCQWPGCSQPSSRCDLDHAHDFHAGGQTCRKNLGPFCRQHHNAKTHGYWRYERDPDGTGHLRSPLGKRYVLRPPRQPPTG